MNVLIEPAVPAIFTQMSGDAVRATFNRKVRGA
jgi:hypothetical protein